MSKSNIRLVQGAVAWAVAIAALAAAPQTSMAQENSQGTQRGIIAILKPGEHPGGANRATASMRNPGPIGRTGLKDPGPSQAPGAHGGLIGLLKPGAQAPAPQNKINKRYGGGGGAGVPAGVNR